MIFFALRVHLLHSQRRAPQGEWHEGRAGGTTARAHEHRLEGSVEQRRVQKEQRLFPSLTGPA